MTDAPDYRDTVFLPDTPFPMRGGLPKKEPEILAQWGDLYATLRAELGRQSRGRALVSGAVLVITALATLGCAWVAIGSDVSAPVKALLVLASYVFYSFWSVPFLLLLFLSSLFNYGAGLAIGGYTERAMRLPFRALAAVPRPAGAR